MHDWRWPPTLPRPTMSSWRWIPKDANATRSSWHNSNKPTWKRRDVCYSRSTSMPASYLWGHSRKQKKRYVLSVSMLVEDIVLILRLVSSLGRRHMRASAEEHGLLVYERDFFCLFPENHDTSPYLGYRSAAIKVQASKLWWDNICREQLRILRFLGGAREDCLVTVST